MSHNPLDTTYLAFQRGMIQQMVLQLESFMEITRKGEGKTSRKFRNFSFESKKNAFSGYYPIPIVNDLEVIGKLRNEWVKKLHPDYDKIREWLNSMNYFTPTRSQKSKLSLYRNTIATISMMNSYISGAQTDRNYWKEVGIEF